MSQEHFKAVLVVDDSPLILNVVGNLLTAEGYKVHISENGKQALDIIENEVIDIVICDIMMPEMNGWDLHKEIRNRDNLSHVPFVFLTSVNEQKEINQAKSQGADDYVVKPFNPADLIALVHGKIKRADNLKSVSEKVNEKFKKNLVQTVSHELRTPLVAIKTGAEMLLHDELNADQDMQKDILKAILRGGDRLESFVNDFVTMQQIELGVPGDFNAKNFQCSAAEVVNSFYQKKSSLLKQAGFEVALNLQDDGIVNISSEHLSDIIKRLLGNAVKFSRLEKQIRIKVFTKEHNLIVEVADRGIGISSDNPEQALKPFVQLGRDKLEQQGVGLGLAIANFYAKLYGGRIELRNRHGGGLAAALILPLN